MDTLLTYGASGECVDRLTALARAAGVDVHQTDQLDQATLDTIVTSLALGEQLEGVAETGQAYKGRVINDAVWSELRTRAAARTGLQVATTAAEAPAPAEGQATTPFPSGGPSA